MPDIILPGRRDASPGRSSSHADPDPDPLAGLPDDVREAVFRQQRLRDATAATTIRQDLTNSLRDGLVKRATEADIADDAVRVDYNAFVGNAIVDAKKRYRSATGAARLSEEAGARLDATLDDIGQTFVDQSDTLHLQGIQRRGLDQLTALADETAGRVRKDVAVAPIDDALMFLLGELDAFDKTVAGFTGAFRQDNERDLLAAGRVQIIGATLTGLTELGRGKEAQALLENEEIALHLDEVTRARLKKNTQALTQAHDRDRVERGKREIAEEANKREIAALAFTANFRPRLATGAATLAEITGAETEGILTPARADRLRTELADEQNRREKVSVRAARVTSALQAGDRLDPEDVDDYDDLAHHYEATLKPSLADLDPAQKAFAIAGHVAETGVAPQPALKTLLGLAVTGEPTGRIAAARALSNIFAIDPTAREKMPPALAAHAETMVQIADMDTIGPEDIVKAADSLFSDKTPGGGPDQPNSALLQLAKAETNAAVQTDAQSDTAAEDDAAETEVTEDTEGDENELFFDEGDNDGAADALLEEYRDFRGALLEDGIAPETPIVGSVDALTEAIARRDPDEMETRIGQLEAQLNEARTHLTDETAPVQLASLEGIGGPLMNPRLLQAWDKGLKQLDRARKFLGSLGRGLKRGDRGQRLPNPDQSNEDGVIIPRPPSAPDSSESTEDETRGIGNNQPPAIPSQFGRLNFPGNVRKFDVGSPDNRERVIFQPNNDPNRLLARARQQAPQLETDLRKITKPLPGAELAGVRVKDMDQAGFDRLQAKINRIKSPEMIPDYVGGRIYVESPSDLNRVEKILKEKFEIINRDDTLEQPRGPAGYRAVHLQVKLPDGMTAEIQLHPGIYRTFEKEARDAYVRSRSISSRGLSPAQLNELKKADSAVATKFTRAYQDWLAKGSKP